MAREEAIAIIENEKECVNRANKNDYCNRDCYNCELVKTDTEILTALDMAIKALQQEPCEDAISRQAVIDACDQSINLFEAVDRIKELPPVTPQPKTGHWIFIGNSDVNGLKICECDVCGKRTYGSHNFCPNCGAKMVEPQESEDKE